MSIWILFFLWPSLSLGECIQEHIPPFEKIIEPEPEVSTESLLKSLSSLDLVQQPSPPAKDSNNFHKHAFLKENIVFIPSTGISAVDEIKETSEQPAHTKQFKALEVSPAFMEKYFQTVPQVKWHEDELVCIKKGTPIKSIPYLYESGNGFQWFNINCLQVELGIVNFISKSKPLKLFWISPRNERLPQGDINYGEPNTIWRQTYIGHSFLLTGKNEATGEDFATEIVISSDTFKVIGSQYQKSQLNARKDISENELKNVDRLETKRANRVEKTFTNAGYKRLPMPKRLWGSIQYFWNNNKVREDNMFEEIWNGRSIYVNWWKAVPLMSVAPFGLKAKWHELLQPILESWASTCLEPTDLYGIRSYYDGNWLLNHVDRHETHAVSAIINVEQNNMREDWELEVVHLNGTVVRSPLYEEEMMLYESAKVLHGRPDPLQGERYVNVFFHYRPKLADPSLKWWELTDTDAQTAPKSEL